MMRTEETIWCDGCGVEITWGAIIKDDRTYCCLDCFHGLPCECGYRMELDDDDRILNTKPSLPSSSYMA